ncbi:Bug family tripartite tricarboxylate transporter substrate binding protein [Pollutimonas subterranea]|nr:tripartite tricarboxylate transporter substrate binding protein [Pollutimonas subterranea]
MTNNALQLQLPYQSAAMAAAAFIMAMLAMLFTPPSFAQPDAWPKKPITLIVPFPAGGMTDVLARRIGRDMQETLKQSVVIENRPGASGQIGTQHVAQATPDGYTLLVSATHHAINPALRHNLPYDASKDFTAIALLATTPNLLVVNKDIPVSNLQEYLAYAKKMDGGMLFASSSVGGATHLSGELLKLMTGAPMAHISYKGATPALQDLLGGHVPSLFHDVMTMAPFVKDGQVKAIGVTSSTRSEALPDVPTIAEQGVQGYEAITWIGFYGPAGLDKSITDKLNAIAVKSLNNAEAKEYFTLNGTSPGELNPEQFDSFVHGELTKWKRVVQDANLKVE